MHYVLGKIYYGGFKHNSLYLGLVLPSGGWQSLISYQGIELEHRATPTRIIMTTVGWSIFFWCDNWHYHSGKSWERFYSDSPVIMWVMGNGMLSGWLVGSDVGLGLLYWCNSGDVPRIGAVVFWTSSNGPNPAPIIGLFSSSMSSNQMSYLRGVQQKPSKWKRNIRKYFLFITIGNRTLINLCLFLYNWFFCE